MTAVADMKVPPHSIDAEQALIGAVLSFSDCLADIDLESGQFYRREHRIIWEAIRDLEADRAAIDALTVLDRLADKQVLRDAGGTDYVAELASSAIGSAHARHYASIVRDKAQERHLIAVGHKLADMGYNPDGRSVAERLAEAQGLLADMDAPEGDEPVQVDQCLREAVREMERRMEAKGELLGLSTGFRDLDTRTQGLQNGDLILLAGRPSMGKTTLAMNFAEAAALSGKLVIVFSLEMPRQSLTLRMISSLSRLPFNRVRMADLRADEWDKVPTVASMLRGRNLWIDDNSMLTSAQLLARARRIARRLGQKPALIVVDYLQLLTDKGEGVERVTKISRNLKLAAKELDCPVVALSQLSRKVEERSDKRPLMSDLRDSGSLEQDADLVLMVYRDEVYNTNSRFKGVAEILCRKFRNGEIGEDQLASNLHCCRFDNLQLGWAPEPEPKKRGGGFAYDD